MYCSHLSELKSELSEEKIAQLKDYLTSLTPNSRNFIVPSKIMMSLDVDYETSVKALLILEKLGYLVRHYGIKCPECSMLIRTADTVDLLDIDNLNNCYGCGDEIEISKDDIIILFKAILDDIPFEPGQQIESSVVNEGSDFVAQKEDFYCAFSKMEKHLEKIALNADHERESRKRKEESDGKSKEYTKKAIKICKRNTVISLFFSVFAYLILVCTILYVYKTYGFTKITIFSTFGSSFIPFALNYIVVKILPQDVNLIKTMLENK